MTLTAPRIAALACLAAALALPAHADSIASSASSATSESIGSSSTSVEKSSKSSSGGNKVAAGDYRVLGVTVAEQRPGQVRVHLQALADPTAAGEVLVWMPQAAAARGAVATGQVLTAQARDWGFALAKAGQGQAFFLVMDDDVHRELSSQRVVL